jgi:hypothetical protein
MDQAIYGVRRRGIFDSVRLPKGFSDQRNDALTNYNNGKAIPGTLAEIAQPQDPIIGGGQVTVADYMGSVTAGSAGAGLVCAGQLWNDAPFPIQVRRVYASVNANAEMWMHVSQTKFAPAASYWVLYKKSTMEFAPYGKLLLTNNLLVEFPYSDTASSRIRIGDTRILANTINVLWDDSKGALILRPMTGLSVCVMDGVNSASVWTSFEVTY